MSKAAGRSVPERSRNSEEPTTSTAATDGLPCLGVPVPTPYRGNVPGNARWKAGSMIDAEPGWVRIQREAAEQPETDEAAALALLKRELGATEAEG